MTYLTIKQSDRSLQNEIHSIFTDEARRCAFLNPNWKQFADHYGHSRGSLATFTFRELMNVALSLDLYEQLGQLRIPDN